MSKKICVYALLCAVCILCGYIESLVSLSFIAPGIKLGLANAVALLLIIGGDFKGAFTVNITRIILCALLFSNLFSLAFSLPSGIISLFIAFLFYRLHRFSAVGISVIGGVVHNIVQSLVAYFILGVGVFYYLPFLLIAGAISGTLIGILVNLTYKKIEKFLKL